MSAGPEPHIATSSSPAELDRRAAFLELFRQSPVPDRELLANLGLYTNRQALSRVLFLHELYQRILPVHGVVMEFGVRWGQNLALFHSFRGMYEPFNYYRRIVGFDTWAGFPSVDAKDGSAEIAAVGAYGVAEGYREHLEQVLAYHESESPLGHLRRFELVQGDAAETVPAYLERNPETIVALAYFDFDLYEPTKACLEAIRPHLTRGSVIGFDELNCPSFPGETLALREVFGLDRFRIERIPISPTTSFLVVD
jgi:hypothetical protein